MFCNKGEPKIEIIKRKCHVDNTAARCRDCKEIPAHVIGHLIMFKSFEEPGHVLHHILGVIQTVQLKSDGGFRSDNVGGRFNIQHDGFRFRFFVHRVRGWESSVTNVID